MQWQQLISKLRNKPWTYRLKIVQQPVIQEWSNWLISPTETYLETEKQGPYPMTQIEWIDINPIEIREVGKLFSPIKKDHSTEIAAMLSSKGFIYKKVEHLFRICTSNVHPI